PNSIIFPKSIAPIPAHMIELRPYFKVSTEHYTFLAMFLADWHICSYNRPAEFVLLCKHLIKGQLCE
ncbi:MAG: hypothetical protein JXB29_06610, partial [Sedimentisphaerales bacterium]|nr:hypothetical protein [Sedimentisphaerales bacterium]